MSAPTTSRVDSDQMPLLDASAGTEVVHLPQGEGGGWTAAGDHDDMRRRLLAKSEPTPGGCRLWQKELNSSGYGKLNFHGQKVLAHRAAMYVATGVWPPPWLYVLHACDVRACIAVEHLSLGSPRDNAQDALRKGRLGRGLIGTCPNGHPYAGQPPARKGRRCHACQLARNVREAARKRANYDPEAQRERNRRRRGGSA